jgi:glycosyltransferase involved in cell wall biosynthesis
MSVLIAIPVYNEAGYVRGVLDRVREFADNILLVDDGSTDGTPEILEELREPMGLDIIRHPTNYGYGRALRESFEFASREGYDWVITMDCDEQHEPAHIPDFIDAIERDNLDIVSGSRYLNIDAQSEIAPADRRAINMTLSNEINDRLGFTLTDAFCGFKAHRVSAMDRITLTEDGYAFPMQLWAQAAAHELRVGEVEVDLIYNDPNRTFGGGLDDSEHRLAHYRKVLDEEITRAFEAVDQVSEHSSSSKSSEQPASTGECSGCRCC